MSEDEDDVINPFNSKQMMKIRNQIEKQKKKGGHANGMFVSGWDDADEGVEEEKHPRETPEKEILWAAENGKLDTVKSLLLKNSDLVNVFDNDGYTPLHRACYNDHVDVVNYLLSKGASVSARTKMGWEPLHSACQWNNPNCIARLIAAGANVNALSNGDQSPLHIVTSISDCKKMLELLLLHPDIKPHVKNNSGDLPKDLARRKGTFEYLFDMSDPEINFIKSPSFTENPFIGE